MGLTHKRTPTGALLNWIAGLQKIFQCFPRESNGDLDFSPLEKQLQKDLRLNRVLFLVREKDGLTGRRGNTFLSTEDKDLLLKNLKGRTGPFFPKANQLSGWSGFWPILVGGDLAGAIALGEKKNGKRLKGEEVIVLELLIGWTALLFEKVRLRRMLEKAGSQSNLGFMTAAMVHEIRNPLTAMGTLVQLFPRKRNDERFMESFQTLMLREINHLERLTGSFLDFSFSKAGQSERVDLSEAVNRVAQLLTPVFELKKVQLKVNSKRNLHVFGDEHQLKCLIMNLLQNALQAVGPKGAVRITTRVSGNRNPGPGSWVKLCVEDDGPGVPFESQRKLFDPYFTTKEGGLGLGLSICRKIIENHQGSISAKNMPGGGFQVNVLIPVKKA